MFTLNPIEARVLGALAEKEINTPEYYPLSLNATLNACNQKSSREPVMELTEADVRTALFELTGMGLVRTIADARVTKFEHRMRDVLNLRRDETAVMCLLLLRGPQTPAELRARTERMFSFDDNTAVATTLERLSTREDALTVLLPRQPGSREARWMHLLCGVVEGGVTSAQEAESKRESPALLERMEALEELVRTLEARIVELESSREAL